MTAAKESNKPKHTRNDDGHAKFILAENEPAVHGCVFGEVEAELRRDCGADGPSSRKQRDHH